MQQILHASIGQEEGDVEWPLSATSINTNSMCYKQEHQGPTAMHPDSIQ